MAWQKAVACAKLESPEMLSASGRRGHGDVLEQLLRAFVRVEEADLEIEHRLAGHAEKEMARLDDARMNRPDRDLEHAFAFDLAELVPLALERRQHGVQVEVLPQRINFRPVVVQRAAAGIGMAFELEAEQILYFALLPVDGGQGVGEGNELGLAGGHRHAQDEEAVRRIQREDVVEVEGAAFRAGIVGEEADQPPVPFLVELGAEAGDQFHLGVEIDFVGPGRKNGLDAGAKAFGQVRQNRLETGEYVVVLNCIHGAPPMMDSAMGRPGPWIMAEASRMRLRMGVGSHKLKRSKQPSMRPMAGTPSRGEASLGRTIFGAPARMRVNW